MKLLGKISCMCFKEVFLFWFSGKPVQAAISSSEFCQADQRA